MYIKLGLEKRVDYQNVVICYMYNDTMVKLSLRAS